MPVDIRDTSAVRGEHVVQLYEHDRELTGAVVPYLAAGLSAGETVIAIASGAHLRAFAQGLDAVAADSAGASPSDGLIALDAAATLSMLIPDRKIEAEAFAAVVAAPIRHAAESGRSVRVYGEMVSLLWLAGDVITAIKLEELWNELAGELPFTLFCSYAAASMEASEHTDALHHVCALHSSVLPASPEPSVGVEQLSPRELTAEFSAARDAPGRARRFAVASLRRWGIGDTLVSEAALVLSELANNAVLHARSAFSIAICAQGSGLRIAVADTRSLGAVGEDGSLVARFGHGLSVIEALSSEWGVEARADGKVVWAELLSA